MRASCSTTCSPVTRGPGRQAKKSNNLIPFSALLFFLVISGHKVTVIICPFYLHCGLFPAFMIAGPSYCLLPEGQKKRCPSSSRRHRHGMICMLSGKKGSCFFVLLQAWGMGKRFVKPLGMHAEDMKPRFGNWVTETGCGTTEVGAKTTHYP
ncbi:hypothetical protein F4801DRAFT_120282 [Xylaria longipes]|nr:hypothetical protein F4801DRAFT_120282 [Xylaria longipes]